MAIRLYDSLSREVRELRRPDPSDPTDVFRMYCCGPTVYAPAHIGNFRTFLVQDVLRRLLELEFGPGKVKHVRNLTDVDDRTIAQAKREKRPLAEITQKWTDKFHDDCRALNILPMDPPHVEPKATEHIPDQVGMINELLAKGLAYVAPDGSVYYKIAAFPPYGALSRVKERELKVTVTAADDDHKDAVGDFALWKAYKPDEDGAVQWPGPKGAAAGRPGWHIECSAMSRKHLGETIDLHAGGVDLLFPHHENEIAQSEGCTGHTFSRHWYHTKHLLVNGKKMSKSLGNLYTLDDLTAKGFSPMAVRYALLFGKPRDQLNFSLKSLQDAQTRLEGIGKRIRDLGISGNALFSADERDLILANTERTKWASFDAAHHDLCDELNVPECLGKAALAFRESTRKDMDRRLSVEDARIEFSAAVRLFRDALGFTLDLESVEEKQAAKRVEVPQDIRQLAGRRWAARQAKDFKAADALRQELAAAGWSMLDGKDGYKLEPLKKA